jgi:hypothetical protein
MKAEIKEHDVDINRINALVEAFDGICKLRVSHHGNWCVLSIHILEELELSFYSIDVSDPSIFPKEID